VKGETEQAPHVFVLSAQHKGALHAHALQMRHFLRSATSHSLRDIVYGLQNSREALAARLAIVASTQEEVVLALDHFLNNEGVNHPSLSIFVGHESEHHSKIRLLMDKDAEDTLLKRYIEQRDLSKLALYWVAGSNVPWCLLYKEPPTRVTDLPLYPFARWATAVTSRPRQDLSPQPIKVAAVTAP
jgi:acyl transferase domain-containing protein